MKKATVLRLTSTLDFLKNAELEKAYDELTESLSDDLENDDVEYALKAVKYWLARFSEAKQATTPMERGEFMISCWKPFLSFINKQGESREVIIYALKQAVFLLALKFYSELFAHKKELQEAEPYRKIGICYKTLGDYDEALNFLKYAAKLDENSAPILAELADCYACYGETKLSKVFFREAFFINPSEIELQFLESELIVKLIERVKNLGVKTEYIAEWLPIYGRLDGVFTVKRELRSVEFGQLKQKIFLMECEIKEASNEQKERMVPRLINYYFWLIDHYVAVQEDKAKIDDILLRIKVWDKNIYDCYIG